MPSAVTNPKTAWGRLRKLALSYPETHEDHPWGHCAFKVRNKKIFLFLNGADDPGLSLSVKLPASSVPALSLPFAEPTGYGLGKHGWVTARFEAGEAVPVAMLAEWVDESFRAVAPKTIVRSLGEV